MRVIWVLEERSIPSNSQGLNQREQMYKIIKMPI